MYLISRRTALLSISSSRAEEGNVPFRSRATISAAGPRSEFKMLVSNAKAACNLVFVLC